MLRLVIGLINLSAKLEVLSSPLPQYRQLYLQNVQNGVIWRGGGLLILKINASIFDRVHIELSVPL